MSREGRRSKKPSPSASPFSSLFVSPSLSVCGQGKWCGQFLQNVEWRRPLSGHCRRSVLCVCVCGIFNTKLIQSESYSKGISQFK